MAIEVSVQNPRSCKALALFARCSEWQTGRRKSDGRSFFLIPGSNDTAYYVDAHECTCPDFVRRGAECKHQLAVKLWLAAFQTGQVRPRGRTTTSQDDLAVLLPAGAAYLAEQSATVAPAQPSVWHPCTAGCGELLAPEHRYPMCDHCSARRSALLAAI